MKDIGKIYQEAFKDFEQNPPKNLFNTIARSWKRQTNLKFYKKWIMVSGIAVAVVSAVILSAAKTEESMPVLVETNIEKITEISETTNEITETIVNKDVFKLEAIDCGTGPETELIDSLVISQNLISPETEEIKVESKLTKSNDNIKEISKNNKEIQTNDFKEKIEPTIIVESEPFSNSEIIEEEKPAIFVPSAFSPDGDGINETFKIETEQDFAAFEWSVYSKTGRMLYHTKSVHGYWDGTFKGQPMPRDMYIYVVSYTDKQGQKRQMKGSFMLLK